MAPRIHYARIITCGALELKGEKSALLHPPGVLPKGIIVGGDLTCEVRKPDRGSSEHNTNKRCVRAWPSCGLGA